MRYRERFFWKKGHIIAVLIAFGLLLGTGCGKTQDDGFGAAGEGESEGDGAEWAEQEARERKSETIAFGEGSEWESWEDYLYQATKDEKYVFAFIETADGSAEFEWAYYDDREAMTDAFSKEKGLREDLSWYFLKLRIDSGVCGLEIYDYFKQNYEEEGYIVEAWTMDEGHAYNINLEWEKALKEEYTIRAKRKAIVQNGYLYLLCCEEVNDDNREAVSDRIYAWERYYDHTEYGGGWFMDEETFYWSDHTARTTTLENPERKFVEERASDATWPDVLMGYFGLVSEAEYRIQLAPDMPEMTITFRLNEDLLKEKESIYLWNGHVMDEPYQMEIRTVEGEELIQKTDVELCIEIRDIIYFEDLDEDGCLDMRILYPAHDSDSDEIHAKYEDYWVWDTDIEKMVRVNEQELQARRSENAEEPEEKESGEREPEEEEIPQTNLSVIPITVEKGDSLWKISEEYYGVGKYWVKIYEYNQTEIGENPSLIYEGMELILPWMRDWD